MGFEKNIQAILWDYDGTLVDTRLKNLNVTRKIIEKISGIAAENFRALQTLSEYHAAQKETTNWREFYKLEFGLSEEQTDLAGKFWTEYQLRDNTPVPFYDGIEQVIVSLGNFPQGIVSQNSRNNMERFLTENGLSSYFRFIVGYEEVDMKKQKPEPDGLLMCIRKLSNHNSGYVFYIGDHETDIQCAVNANQALKRENLDIHIISIGASYGSGTGGSAWSIQPDYEAHSTEDIITIVDNFL